MSKKLLFITTRIFWPANSGRKVCLYYYCKGLCEKYGYDIYLYSFLEADQVEEQCINTKPDFIKDITFAKHIGKGTKIKNLLSKSLFNNFPLQCSLFYSRENGLQIQKMCEEHNFDLIITDMIRLAPYYEFFSDQKCIKLSDMDDLLSKRYQRTLETDGSSENILGQYSKFLPDFVNKKILPIAKDLILKSEIKRLISAEEYYAKLYDGVIFVSDLETRELNDRIHSDKCRTITLGVDYDYFSQPVAAAKDADCMAFVGNFGYTPNVDSLKIIVNNIMPKLPAHLKLLVVGKAPKDVVDKYASDRVIFTGMVDDLREYVNRASVFVSPIAYGSGIKTKILEAMAMKIPVVTNSIGAEGLSVVNGQDLVVTDDYNEMALKIQELLNDAHQRAVIGENGSKYVQKYHQWENVYKGFEFFKV